MLRRREGASAEGSTLVELLVVLVILGLLGSVSAVALRSRPHTSQSAVQLLEHTRRLAIRSGQPATVRDSLGRPTRFLPDGRATGPGVDPLTGRIRGAQ